MSVIRDKGPQPRPEIPREFVLPREATVRPIISMGRDGLPVDSTKTAGGKTDNGPHLDVLGVLNGHKRVSIVPGLVLRPDGYPAGEPPPPAVKAKGGWAAWQASLLDACSAADIVYLRVTRDVAYIFKRADLKYAALLYLLYHAPEEERQRLDMAGGFVIGRLLGYADRDIEAWYLGQALDVLLLSDAYRAAKPGDRRALAARTACARRLFHENFMRMAAITEDKAAALLRGPKVGTAMEALARRIRRVRSRPSPDSSTRMPANAHTEPDEQQVKPSKAPQVSASPRNSAAPRVSSSSSRRRVEEAAAKRKFRPKRRRRVFGGKRRSPRAFVQDPLP